LVPLADNLPTAPDLADGEGQFVIESDDDLGTGPADLLDDDLEGQAMAKLVKEVESNETYNKPTDEAGATSVQVPVNTSHSINDRSNNPELL